MQTSKHPVYKLLTIFAASLAGSGGCHSTDSQKTDEAPATRKTETANNVTSENEDAIDCGFFGLDNGLPRRVNAVVRGASGKDGMPLNFKDEIDASTLDAEDFLVINSEGEKRVPIGAILMPADEEGENRTVLLIGEFGTGGSNPPVEVKIVGDLQTKAKHEDSSAPSIARNLKNASTRNVIPLDEGPRLFFAQIVKGDLAEQSDENSQVVQVAWQGGITPVDKKIAEKDLFQFYTVYVHDDDKVTPLTPKSIADINDNDNYHQLLVETQLPIVKVSMPAGIVKDPNGDSNPETQVMLEY